MLGIENFETFIIAGILLNLTPGNDTMYVLSRSVAQGKAAGLYSALGIGTGSLIHTFLAAAGLSVLLTEFHWLFIAVKIAGAGYLVFLGLKALLRRTGTFELSSENLLKQDSRKIFFSAIVTNVLNPKVALFYLAFLPQFINPAYNNPFLSFILLGTTFTVTGTIWCLVLASFSSMLTHYFRAHRSLRNILEKGTGIVFIILGIRIAMTEKH